MTGHTFAQQLRNCKLTWENGKLCQLYRNSKVLKEYLEDKGMETGSCSSKCLSLFQTIWPAIWLTLARLAAYVFSLFMSRSACGPRGSSFVYENSGFGRLRSRNMCPKNRIFRRNCITASKKHVLTQCKFVWNRACPVWHQTYFKT